jgi:diacylglycerol kinase (ATP)
MKSKLIVNPVSGTDDAAERLTMMNRRLRERTGTLDIVITVSEGDGLEAGRQAVQDGYDHIFVAGGDGTLNEVLNGVADVEGGLAAVTFGVIPLGTGNDFATALGLPDDAEAAVQLLLESEPLPVDVGRLNGRYFINVSAGGFIAEVSDVVSPKLKTLAGKLAYLIGGAQVLLDYEAVAARVRPVGGDGRGNPANPQYALKAENPACLLHTFAVCNSRLVGGGRLIAPHALIDDGQLDVCLIHAMPTLDFIGLLRRVSTGDHVEDDRVTYLRAPEIELAFDRAIKVNTDGQVLETDRCHYRIMPRAARFLGRKPGYEAIRAGTSSRQR